jgi:hypothetical protein
MKRFFSTILLMVAMFGNLFAQTAPIVTVTSEGTLLQGSTLIAKLNWLDRSAESHNTYIVEVSANENIAPRTLAYRGAINITVILRGDSINRIIRLSSHGAMFTVTSNVTFILDNNITLHGHKGNTGSMVSISGGTFIMNNGATITGNNENNRSGSGSGVYVGSGIFTMTGGIISDNTANGYGGGVYVKGTFNMTGGTITGNTASEGGGVCIGDFNGTFTMTGGTISNNTASKGGGVNVSGVSKANTFTMRDGTITSNIATEYGGGVFVNSFTSFTKTKGTITGYKNDPDNGNVVRDAEGVIVRRGHAVYIQGNIKDSKRRESTAEPRINLSSGSAENWEQ